MDTTHFIEAARRLEAAHGVARRDDSFEPVLDGLIGTILSQNTTGGNTRRAFAELMRRFPTWDHVLDTDVEEVEDAIRVAGLAKIRSRRIQAILGQLREERGALDLEFLRGEPPEEVTRYLMRFKGVGVKTAACVQLFTLKRADFAVDTHVHRVVRRLGWAPPGATRDQVYHRLNPIIPDAVKYSLHVGLIRHGRKVCKAQRPRCGACALIDQCPQGRALHDAAEPATETRSVP